MGGVGRGAYAAFSQPTPTAKMIVGAMKCVSVLLLWLQAISIGVPPFIWRGRQRTCTLRMNRLARITPGIVPARQRHGTKDLVTRQ